MSSKRPPDERDVARSHPDPCTGGTDAPLGSSQTEVNRAGVAVSSQRVSSGCRLAVALLIPSILLLACGASRGVVEGNAAKDAGLHQAQDQPRVHALACNTNQRSMAIYDHFSDEGGLESPEAAVKPFVGTDEVVVDESGEGGPVVWVLRADGTAHTRFELRQFADGTFVVEQADSCLDGATRKRP